MTVVTCVTIKEASIVCMRSFLALCCNRSWTLHAMLQVPLASLLHSLLRWAQLNVLWLSIFCSLMHLSDAFAVLPFRQLVSVEVHILTSCGSTVSLSMWLDLLVGLFVALFCTNSFCWVFSSHPLASFCSFRNWVKALFDAMPISTSKLIDPWHWDSVFLILSGPYLWGPFALSFCLVDLPLFGGLQTVPCLKHSRHFAMLFLQPAQSHSLLVGCFWGPPCLVRRLPYWIFGSSLSQLLLCHVLAFTCLGSEVAPVAPHWIALRCSAHPFSFYIFPHHHWTLLHFVAWSFNFGCAFLSHRGLGMFDPYALVLPHPCLFALWLCGFFQSQPLFRFCLLVVWTLLFVFLVITEWLHFNNLVLRILQHHRIFGSSVSLFPLGHFIATCLSSPCVLGLVFHSFLIHTWWISCDQACCYVVPQHYLFRFCSFSVWTLWLDDLHLPCSCVPYLVQFRYAHIPTCSNLFRHSPKIFFRNTRDLFGFDHTCGFPGEGPFWSCISANVNSVNSHPDCLLWKDDLICLQETRLSLSGYNQHRHELLSKGRDFFVAKLLQASRQKNGIKHIPHGGTACVASKDTCRNFTSEDDSTGLWSELAESTRISAVWIQILPKLKLLAFSFYRQATLNGISSHDINNLYMEKILTICAQFGDIPCLICGDFQDDPDSYSCIQHAKNFADWCDPLVKTLDDGSISRPITYSRNSDFISPSDNFSSIDGILLNRVAATALVSIDVLHSNARQHAPIRACFKWDRVFQKGYTLVKPAPLDLSKLPTCEGKLDQVQLEASAEKLWDEKFSSRCSQSNDDKAWQSINGFAVHSLCAQGAFFKKGPRNRGKAPVFKPHIACPGQDISGAALTCESSKLGKLHRLITELV